MNGFRTVREELAGKLTAAGIPATLDPRAVPPCVLVGPAEPTGRVGIGAWATTVPVHVVAPPPGDDAALVWLEDQLEAVLVALSAGAADAGTYDAAGKDCPAYTVTVTVDVPHPNC